jgi:hypothetical protein
MGQAKFAENLRASPFNKDLSNETTFSLIHLAGQVKYIKIGVHYLLIQSVLKDLLCKKEMNLEE